MSVAGDIWYAWLLDWKSLKCIVMINCGLDIMHLEWIECCRNCFGVKFSMAWFIDKMCKGLLWNLKWWCNEFMMYVIVLDCDPVMWLWLNKHIWCYGLYFKCLGFFGTCSKVPKTSSSDATGVAPSSLCVLLGDKGKPKKLGTHGAWQKMWSRQAEKIW